MQSNQHYIPQKSLLPLGEQVGGDYMYDPAATRFGPSFLPPSVPFTPFQGIGLQSSEACPRNFIIFDHSDNRSRIMFHPAVAFKFGNFGQNVETSYLNNVEKDCVKTMHSSVSSSCKEDSEDIDALLSLGEEDHEEYDDDEVSTACTTGNYACDSPDSCSNYESEPKKSRSSSSRNNFSSRSSIRGRKCLKMKKMVRALRGIIPGASGMNNVAVIDEAVRYLKSLKVEVQKLGFGSLTNHA